MGCQIFAVLLRQGLPRFALPGPLSAAASRRRKQPRAPHAGARRMRARSTRAQDVLPANPGACSRSLPGMDARQTAAARVPFSLVTFFLGKQKKVTGDQEWSTKRTRT